MTRIISPCCPSPLTKKKKATDKKGARKDSAAQTDQDLVEQLDQDELPDQDTDQPSQDTDDDSQQGTTDSEEQQVEEYDTKRKGSLLSPGERIELLAEPKHDPLDKSVIPRPPHVVPERFLPKWYRTPLFNKIPAKSDPYRPVTFTRPELGKSLHLDFDNKVFDTRPVSDLPLEYNSLHDPHLRRYYKYNVRNYLGLVKDQWITPYRDYVVCSQADFNNYRLYVRSIMLKEEDHRRITEEREIERARMERHREILGLDRNLPLEWVKRALKKKKIHNIELLEFLEEDEQIKLEERYDEEGEEIDEEHEIESAQLAQIREEEERLRLASMGGKFEKHLQRIIGFDERRENHMKEKMQKADQMWKSMAAEEIEHMKRIHELRKRYEMQFKMRVDEREERYRRIRAKDREILEAFKAKRSRKKKTTPGKYQEESKDEGIQEIQEKPMIEEIQEEKLTEETETEEKPE